MRLTPFVPLSLLAASLAGCGPATDPGDLGGTQPSQPVAQLRIVNAAPGTSNVEVLRSGSTTPLATLSFRAFTTTCVRVPSGTRHTITFRSAGTDLATVDTTFGANERWSIFLTSMGATRRAIAASDQYSATAGTNGLRFVNSSTTSGDVYATPQGTAPGVSTRVISGFAPTALSNDRLPYYARPIEHTEVRLYNDGVTTGTPRADVMLTGLPNSRLATVVFADAGTPVGPTAFLVFPCVTQIGSGT